MRLNNKQRTVVLELRLLIEKQGYLVLNDFGNLTKNFKFNEVLQENCLKISNLDDNNYKMITKEENELNATNGKYYYDIAYNIVLLAAMLQELRDTEGSISINSWFRPKFYNNVVLISHRYHSTITSDHLDGRAIDTSDIKPTDKNIKKWKNICKKYGVNYSIGLYNWGTHLGFRYDKKDRLWDWRK